MLYIPPGVPTGLRQEFSPKNSLYLHRSFIGRTDKIEIKTVNTTASGLERSISGQEFGIDIQVLNAEWYIK